MKKQNLPDNAIPITTYGELDSFADEFAAGNGNRYAITTNSGTAALHMGVAACGCGAGEEWICHKIPQNLGLSVLSLIALFSRSRRWCLRGELFVPEEDTARTTNPNLERQAITSAWPD